MWRYNIKLLIIFIVFSFLLINFNFSVLAENNDSEERRLEINNINLNITMIEDKPMVQLRELATKYRWLLSYHPKKKIITIYDQELIVHLQIGNPEFEDKEMDTAPVIKNGRTFLGLQWVNPLLASLERETKDLITVLNLDKREVEQGEKIKAMIQAYNITEDSLRLKYSSGQLFDLWLMKEKEEVWRWSDGKFFTMALMAKDLEPLEKKEHELEIPISEELKPGRYQLKGKLATKEPLSLKTIEIEVLSQQID